MKKLVDQAMHESSHQTDALSSELAQHTRLCLERNVKFYGRNDVLSSLRNILTSNRQQVVVVHGVSGSGKTSVMSKCITEVASRKDTCKITLLAVLLDGIYCVSFQTYRLENGLERLTLL